jgi:hypothetical protein
MRLSLLFAAASMLASAAWIGLLLLPAKRPVWRPVVVAAALMLSMAYAGLIAAFWTSAEGGYGSLADVSRLFEHQGLLLAGWVHYLAFDLLVGLWEREEAGRIGLSRWVLAPCLMLTFWFGPLGWLAFMSIRTFRLRSMNAGEQTAVEVAS